MEHQFGFHYISLYTVLLFLTLYLHDFLFASSALTLVCTIFYPSALR